MNNENYTCDWFINFFKAIPNDRWRTDALGDAATHCALGHCGVLRGMTILSNDYPWSARALSYLLWEFIGGDPNPDKCNRDDRIEPKSGNHLAAWINDGLDSRYQQPTPKARILQALRDIKAKQEAAAEAFELRPLNLTKRAIESVPVSEREAVPTRENPLAPLMTLL